jgi:hypothetical protein
MTHSVGDVVEVTMYVPVTFKAVIKECNQAIKFEYEDDNDVTYAQFPKTYTVIPIHREVSVRLDETEYRNINSVHIKNQ